MIYQPVIRGTAAGAKLIFSFYVFDTSVSTGAGLINKIYSDFTCRYQRQGEALSAAITPQDITTIGTYAAPTANTNIRIKKIDDTNSPGWYEAQIHLDWVATTNTPAWLRIDLNITGGKIQSMLIPLTTWDAQAAIAQTANGDLKTILGTAVSTPATAGVLDVNLKNIANAAVATGSAQLGVNLVNIAGAAVSTSTAQLGVNAVQAGATAWNSGAIKTTSFTAGAINAAAIATDAIGAAELAADAVTEIAAGVWNALRASYIADGSMGQSMALVDSGTVRAGSLTNTCVLRVGASGVNETYDGQVIHIISGTGAGQARVVKSYDGSTKIATVVENWTTVPDATSIYIIRPLGSVEVASLDAGAITASAFATGAIDANAFDQAAADKVWSTTTRTLSAGAIAAATFAAGALDAVWSTGARSLTTFGTLTTDTATAVWAALTSGITTAGSIGKKLLDWLSGADTSTPTVNATKFAGQTITAAAGVTLPASVASQANLDVAVSTRLAAASYTTPPTVGEIDTQLSGTHGAGAWGGGGGLSQQQVRDAMTLTTLATPSGNSIDSQLSVINAKTTNLPANPAAQTNLDVAVSTRLAAASYTAPDNTSVSAIKAKTDNLPANPAAQTNLDVAVSTRAAASTAVSSADLTPTRAAKLDNLDTTVSSRSTLTAAAVWDALTSGMSVVGSVGIKLKNWILGTDNKALLSSDAQTGVTIPTVSTVTNAVTIGNVTLAASQPNYAPAKAGDQMDLVSAPNATAVSAIQAGLSKPGTAQTIASNSDITAIKAKTDNLPVNPASQTNLDVAISTRAPAATAVSSVDLTPTRAAKLDNLDASVSSRLATAGYTAPPTVIQTRQELDTNSTRLAAIDNKTSALPASPAATGDAMTLTPAYDAAKTAAAITDIYSNANKIAPNADGTVNADAVVSAQAIRDAMTLPTAETVQAGSIDAKLNAITPAGGVFVVSVVTETALAVRVAGVQVTLKNDTGDAILTKTTNSNGETVFNVDAGAYKFTSYKSGFDIPEVTAAVSADRAIDIICAGTVLPIPAPGYQTVFWAPSDFPAGATITARAFRMPNVWAGSVLETATIITPTKVGLLYTLPLLKGGKYVVRGIDADGSVFLDQVVAQVTTDDNKNLVEYVTA